VTKIILTFCNLSIPRSSALQKRYIALVYVRFCALKITKHGAYFIADDLAGGFFAINGGAFPREHNIVHYWAPDSLEWESLEVSYASFFNWLMSTNLNEFYEGLRWSNWGKDVMEYTTNQCVTFYPPLWTECYVPRYSSHFISTFSRWDKQFYPMPNQELLFLIRPS